MRVKHYAFYETAFRCGIEKRIWRGEKDKHVSCYKACRDRPDQTGQRHIPEQGHFQYDRL